MNKKFFFRSFISFNLFFSFVIMTFTGVVLYFAPPGRIARWTEWHWMGFDQSAWGALHTIFSYAFALFALFHLFFLNWKAFLTYIRSKVKKGLRRPYEFITAFLLTLLFFLGTLYDTTPFQEVMQFGKDLSEKWEKKQSTPPIPHTEELRIKDLANIIFQTSPEKILIKLDSLGYDYHNEEQTLKEIANLNHTSPSLIFSQLKKNEKIFILPLKNWQYHSLNNEQNP